MKKVILLISTIVIVVACGEPERKTNPLVLDNSECKVRIILDPIILKDSGTYFKIIPDRNDFKIISAYFDCERKKLREYDTPHPPQKMCSQSLKF